MRMIGLRKKDAADQCKCGEGLGRITEVVICIKLPPFIGDILNWIKIGLLLFVW